MQLTFEHLLGLPAEAALGVLHASGITDVEVVLTSAPLRKSPPEEPERNSPQAQQSGYVSTRVVSVRDDGRRLYVARFLTPDPKPKASEGALKKEQS